MSQIRYMKWNQLKNLYNHDHCHPKLDIIFDVYGFWQQNLSASKVLQHRNSKVWRIDTLHPEIHGWTNHPLLPMEIPQMLAKNHWPHSQPGTVAVAQGCHNIANKRSYLSKALYKISFFRSGRPNLAVGTNYTELVGAGLATLKTQNKSSLKSFQIHPNWHSANLP